MGVLVLKHNSVFNLQELSDPGDTCVTACNQLLPAAKKCDPGQQRRIGGAALNTVVTALNGGVGCNNHNPPGERISTTRSDWAPYVINGGVANGDCRSSGRGSDSNCNRRGINVQRVCCCVPLGAIVGDPHIETLRGEHYTLLKGGNFVAWSFAKAPIDWQLLAAYSGVRLLDSHCCFGNLHPKKRERDCVWTRVSSSYRQDRGSLLSRCCLWKSRAGRLWRFRQRTASGR